MRSWLVACAIGYWALLLVDVRLYWTASLLFTGLLAIRFRRLLPLIVFGLLACTGYRFAETKDSSQCPEAGLYRITEIRSSYVLASNGEDQVLIQNLEHPNFGQIYQLDSFEEVYSLHNTGLFYFAGWLQQRQVFWKCSGSQASLVRQGQGVQAALFEHFQNDPLARLFLYNLPLDSQDKQEERTETTSEKAEETTKGENWIRSLGLPMLGAVSLLETRLTRLLDSRKSFWICTFLVLFYGHFFYWSLSLARMLIFRLYRPIRSWPWRWSLQMLTFLMLFPWAAKEFAFVLPALISLVRHFCRTKKWIQKGAEIWILMVMQIAYFGKLDFFSILGFSLLRKAWGACFWMEMACIAAWKVPVLSVFLANGIQKIQTLLHRWCLLELPWSCWYGNPSLGITLLFGILGLGLLVHPDPKHLRYCLLGILVYMSSFYTNPFFNVYMIDIGQGDCCVIVEPFQRSVVMIDAAGTIRSSQAQSLIIPFLRSQHLMHVDALIITHDDVDHAGSAEELERNWKVDQIITNRTQSVPVSYPFYSLLPDRTISEDNDESIVNWFSYDSFSYLWTGDASSAVEGQLLSRYNLKADVLKAGHHGSKTSSSQAFLEAVDPKLALISAGYQNRYGHPSPQVMTRFYHLGIDTLQTAQVGMIHLFSWRHWMGVVCADGTVSWITHEDAAAS